MCSTLRWTLASDMNSPKTPDTPRAPSLGRRLRISWQVRIGGTILGMLVLVALLAPFITRYDPARPDVPQRFVLPSRTHFFGTDNLGRDIFSRVVFGSRVSLRIGLVSVDRKST